MPYRTVTVLSLALMSVGTSITIISIMLIDNYSMASLGVGLFLSGLGIWGFAAEEAVGEDLCQVICGEGYKTLATIIAGALAVERPFVTVYPLQDSVLVAYSATPLGREVPPPGVGSKNGSHYLAIPLRIPGPPGDPSRTIRVIFEAYYGSVASVEVAEADNGARIEVRGRLVRRPSHIDAALAAMLASVSLHSGRPVYLARLDVEDNAVSMVLRYA